MLLYVGAVTALLQGPYIYSAELFGTYYAGGLGRLRSTNNSVVTASQALTPDQSPLARK
jgi:hypothetical protein